MAEIRLELTPKTRFDVIDVTQYIDSHHENFFAEYDKAIYCSHHTTAGYLEQSLCDKLKHDSDSVKNFLSPIPGAISHLGQITIMTKCICGVNSLKSRSSRSH